MVCADLGAAAAAPGGAAACLDPTRDAFGQPTELPKDEPIWPIREDQKPDIVHTAAEFLEVLLFQPHLDRVVVLPNGIELLGQQHGIPAALTNACIAAGRAPSDKLSGLTPMRRFLNGMGEAQQERFRGRLWHYGNPSKEKEVKKSGSKRKALHEVVQVFHEQEAEGAIDKEAPLYLTEMRWLDKVRHPLEQTEMVKCATNCDIYDFTSQARRMPLWERSEGGIFVGERGTGSGMHVDQCLWSNVGRNWCGFKLFAIWSWEDRLTIPQEMGKGKLLPLPLGDQEKTWLGRAKCVAMVRPGDVWVFSGGQPHTALVVGDGLNLTAYESLVPAHPAALHLLVRSNTRKDHWDDCWMDDEDLDELYEDVVDNLQRALADKDTDDRLRGRLQECVQTMREKGDSYCKTLWSQEDKGERRRQREEETSSSSSESQDGDAGGDRKAKKAKNAKSSNFD